VTEQQKLDDPKEIGELLKKMRKKAGLSGQKTAQRAGLSRSTINHWENGRRSIGKFRYKKALLTVLGQHLEPADLEILSATMGVANQGDELDLLDSISDVSEQLSCLEAQNKLLLDELQANLQMQADCHSQLVQLAREILANQIASG
jgi:transcriptional regulator with XRE-family HTH domain